MKSHFRVWDIKNKLMLNLRLINFEESYVEACDGDWYRFDEVVLMQSTGLNDRNGSDVYFNDIVEDEYGHRYEVVFEGDCLRCNGIRKIRGGHKPKNRWFGRGLKIIGNIYENPELLEVAE